MIDTAKIADAEQLAELATLQRELAIATNQLASLSDKCSRLEEDNDDLSDKLLRRARRDGESTVLMDRLNDMRAQLRDVERARDQAINEVAQTRGYLQQYEAQIQTVDAAANAEEVEALRKELAMLKQQSQYDLQALQEQLSNVEEQSQQSIDSDNVIEIEALRQQHDVIAHTLSDRESELQASQQTCQLLEDELEDAHKQIDEMRRQLEKYDEAMHDKTDMNLKAPESVEKILAENLNVDEPGVEPSIPVVDIQSSKGLFSGSGMRSMLIGMILAIVAMEVVSFSTGRGELFSAIIATDNKVVKKSMAGPVTEKQKPLEKNSGQEKKTGLIVRE